MKQTMVTDGDRGAMAPPVRWDDPGGPPMLNMVDSFRFRTIQTW